MRRDVAALVLRLVPITSPPGFQKAAALVALQRPSAADSKRVGGWRMLIVQFDASRAAPGQASPIMAPNVTSLPCCASYWSVIMGPLAGCVWNQRTFQGVSMAGFYCDLQS